MNDEIVIECAHLTKDYGSGRGIFDINLSINQGEAFGLIGPNGAGKSTLIKLLMDLIKPTKGKATIFGLDSQIDSLELKKIIGYLPGELMQFPGITAGYILNLLLNIRGIKDRKHMNELAERLQLDLSRKFQQLSHGNKQKVGLIQALMHKPRLLILDEPTLGLDPIVQRELMNIIDVYVSEGNTVILSSHILSEVESACSRIGLINSGQIVKVGTLNELRSTQNHKISVIFQGSLPTRHELEVLGARDVEISGNSIQFVRSGSLDGIVKNLAKFEVLELDSRELSLEEVFFTELEK